MTTLGLGCGDSTRGEWLSWAGVMDKSRRKKKKFGFLCGGWLPRDMGVGREVCEDRTEPLFDWSLAELKQRVE
jgi:hypothetical protein